MSGFFNALLAGVTWMGLTADFGAGTFALGCAMGFGLWRLRRSPGGRRLALRPALRLVASGSRLLAVFLWELVVANLEQLRIVLAPRVDIRPGWILYRSQLETPAARAVLGAIVSLTPGSLTYHEGADERGDWTIRLHVLDLQDEAALVERIRARFEAPLRAMETT